MAGRGTTTAHLEGLLDRLQRGDDTARSELVARTVERIRAIVRKRYPDWLALRRWVEEDDITQAVTARLLKALEDVTPDSVSGLFGLVGELTRRELIDQHRHWYGPEGPGKHHHTDGPRLAADSEAQPLHDRPDSSAGPGTRVERIEQYEVVDQAVEDLRATDREIIDLYFYNGLPLDHCAEVLGISREAAKKRQQATKVRWRRAIERRGGGP
jgi:RNA polymerase sigma factor (sigma-70 family)